MNIKMLKATIAGLVLSISGFANSALITIDNNSSSTTLMDSLLFDGPIVSTYNANNFTLGEIFVGMNVVDPGGSGFESFSGSPSSQLNLLTGTAQNGIGFISGSGVFGNAGISNYSSDMGEGLVAILFDFNISNFGLDINGASSNSGSTTFAFFDINGSLIDTINTAFINSVSFSSNSLIKGVLISNTDRAGQSYSNIRFDSANEVPEPSTLAIFALGIMGLASRRFKKQ